MYGKKSPKIWVRIACEVVLIQEIAVKASAFATGNFWKCSPEIFGGMGKHSDEKTTR